MVMAGGDDQLGLLRVAVKLAGQSAEVVMALGDLLPEPPAGAGLVVVDDAGWLVVVVEADFLDGLKIRYERPITMSATMAMVMVRRRFCFRF